MIRRAGTKYYYNGKCVNAQTNTTLAARIATTFMDPLLPLEAAIANP
jgi:hypothetical protein